MIFPAPIDPYSKPRIGRALDPAAPLARGLICHLPLWEGTGRYCYDAAGGLALAISGATWGSGSAPGLSFAATNSAATSVALPATLQVGWPITFACGFRTLGAATNAAVLFGTSYNSSANSPYFGWALAYYSTTGYNLELNSAGATNSIHGTGLASAGTDAVLSATIGASAQAVYLNGASYCSGSTALSNPTYGAGPQLCVGVEPGTSGRTVNALMYWCAAWNRALTAAEHLSLAQNPWQVYASSSPALASLATPPPRRARLVVIPTDPPWDAIAGRLILPGPAALRAGSGGAPTLVAGSATAGRISGHSVAVTATAATGGSGSVSVHWEYQWPRGGLGWQAATGQGVTSLSAVVGNLGPGSKYLIRAKYTDAANDVAYSDVLTVSTLPRRYYRHRCLR